MYTYPSLGVCSFLTKLFFPLIGVVVVWSEQEKWGCLFFALLGVVGGGPGGPGGADINMHEYDRTRGKKPDPRVVLRIACTIRTTGYSAFLPFCQRRKKSKSTNTSW